MRNKLLDKFGNLVRSARIARKLSQEELAFELGFHRNYIGMIERGERNISFSKAVILIQYLNIDLRDLYDDGIISRTAGNES